MNAGLIALAVVLGVITGLGIWFTLIKGEEGGPKGVF
jgi:hypothetical protein